MWLTLFFFSPHHILSLCRWFSSTSKLMRSESGSKVGVCKCRASKLVMSTSCHENRNLRKKTDPFFSLLHHHTQQFYCMPTSLYVHMMWANFVVKHNKVWNKTLDDLVSKVPRFISTLSPNWGTSCGAKMEHFFTGCSWV